MSREYRVRHLEECKGYSQFEEDLKVAQKTELEVARFMRDKYNAEILGFNSDFRYDFRMNYKDKEVKVEVKEDFGTQDTGNVAVEYKCRGKASGITTTQADVYLYKIHLPNQLTTKVMLSTNKLKEMIKTKQYHRIVKGGDKGSNTMMYLFKLKVFIGNGLVI